MTDGGAGKLRKELQKQTERRDEMRRDVSQLQLAVEETQELLSNIPTESNMWRGRYTQQHSHNQQLQRELEQLERKLEELKGQQEQNLVDGGSFHTYEDMSDAAMRQMLRRMSKEKTETEWQLRECEWRLDQEAAAVSQAEEKKKAMLTELGEVSQLLEQVKQDTSSQQHNTKAQPNHSRARKTLS